MTWDFNIGVIAPCKGFKGGYDYNDSYYKYMNFIHEKNPYFIRVILARFIERYHILLLQGYVNNASMASDYSKLIGNRIRYFRNLRGMTQAELAEAIGIETSTLAHIEIGKNLPAISRLPRIAEVLDIEVYQLFIRREITDNHDLISKITDLLKSADDKQIRLIYEFIGCMLDITAKS